MKEQSHKDEMSRALRGDFERLRGRGVSTTLALSDQTEASPEPVVVLDVAIAPARDVDAGGRPLEAQPPDERPQEEDDAGDGSSRGEPAGDVTAPRPGLFARLIGR